MEWVNVIGGGLAGCEAAYCLAEAGIKVKLFEMRPTKMTAVHQSGDLGELVCSNSLKSELLDTAQGLLKEEMKLLDSLLLRCASITRVPAGSALAVDRDRFSQQVSREIGSHPNIEIVRGEVTKIPGAGISVIATGPLTEGAFFDELTRFTGADNLFFYDAVAPSVSFDSLDLNSVFRASRYGKGTDDYLNCPMNQQEYQIFYDALVCADVVEGHTVDKRDYFEGCMPVEVMARRGVDTMRYGPMRPVGLTDPRTGKRPWAVLQLRQENEEGTVWGLVGCQTRLRWPEQKKVFQLIPGLEHADFVRYGVMHRNTFINSPKLLTKTLQLKSDPRLLFAGQMTGVEGYMESAATGILAGKNAIRLVQGRDPVAPPEETMLGALLQFISEQSPEDFQPINANFGIIPPLVDAPKDKKERYKRYVLRSLDKMQEFSELFATHVVK